MHRTTLTVAATIAVAVATTTACASSDGGPSSPSSSRRATSEPAAPKSSPPAPSSPTAAYSPSIDPAAFTDQITNPYFPLPQGRKLIYEGTKDGAPETVQVHVSGHHMVLGVRCVEVSDIVTSNSTLVEKTIDWYAQDTAGNVWYFGEDTKEFANGVVSSTQGTWEAGVDGAKPGIVMQAAPRVGSTYRQEFRPGVAEDMAKVLRLDATMRVPAGTYRSALVTRDIDPLNPEKVENKSYGKGVGLIRAVRLGTQHHETIALVSASG